MKVSRDLVRKIAYLKKINKNKYKLMTINITFNLIKFLN